MPTQNLEAPVPLTFPLLAIVGQETIKAFSGKENTQYQETLVLDSRRRGNDGLSSLLEIP